MEEWRDISGYEGLYQVSNTGRVKSLRNNIIRKLGKFINGYLFAGLKVNGEQHNKAIHRLVAEEFLPNPDKKREVNHKDGNKQNNNLENLEWVTRQENIAHAFLNNLIRIPGDKSRGDWKGVVNIYNQKGELIGQANTFVEAAEWIWENTTHKRSVASHICDACIKNGDAYGFKFKREKK
jgi:hypothetical protein